MRFQAQRYPRKRKAVTLRTVAEYVGLAPCSISAVLNNAPSAMSIPQHTKQRIFHAAAKLQYQPNLMARSLRTRRTRSIAVITRDLAQRAVGEALAGVGRSASARGYLLVLRTWDGTSSGLNESARELRQRGIEGMILLDAPLRHPLDLPSLGVGLDEDPAPAPRAEAATHTLLDRIERDLRTEPLAFN